MCSLKKVLVAVDGSADATAATRVAAQVAQPLNAELTLAYVTSPPSYSPDWSVWNPQEAADAEQQWAEKMLGELASETRRPSLRVDTVLLRGSAAETVADYAESKGFDMIVCGSRGRGAVARLLVGSVSDRLCHISKRPVLVVR